jgi:uncharacterized protein (TIGR02246 family)
MKSFLITAFFLLCTSQASAQDFYSLPDYQEFGQPDSVTDDQELDAFIAEFLQAWRTQDAQGLAALHAPDVEWINAFGRTFRGRENLQQFLAHVLFPNFSPEEWQAAIDSYRPVSRHFLGDVVVMNSQIHSSPGSAMGGNQRRTSFNFLLVKRAGQWQIAQQVISDIRPRRASTRLD